MKIVVVNVERASDRRRLVGAGLEGLGLDFHIHKAIDWRDLTPEQEASAATAEFRGDGIRLSKGSLAASLSQRAVLTDLVENGPDVLAMLEDDVTFSPEFPEVLDALEELHPRLGIVFLHRGSTVRRFSAHMEIRTGHKLGWTRWSHFGAQGIVVTRVAAKKFLERNPQVRPGLDRILARYWHNKVETFALRPPVVHHVADQPGEYHSLIEEAPVIGSGGPLRKVRRIWYDTKEGARKRYAFSRLVIRSRGLVGGSREILNL